MAIAAQDSDQKENSEETIFKRPSQIHIFKDSPAYCELFLIPRQMPRVRGGDANPDGDLRKGAGVRRVHRDFRRHALQEATLHSHSLKMFRAQPKKTVTGDRAIEPWRLKCLTPRTGDYPRRSGVARGFPTPKLPGTIGGEVESPHCPCSPGQGSHFASEKPLRTSKG